MRGARRAFKDRPSPRVRPHHIIPSPKQSSNSETALAGKGFPPDNALTKSIDRGVSDDLGRVGDGARVLALLAALITDGARILPAVEQLGSNQDPSPDDR